MRPVPDAPGIPEPRSGTMHGLHSWASDMVKRLYAIFLEVGFRVNRVLPKDGSEAMTGPHLLMTYTTATRPTASSWTGAVIYVSDAAAGSKFQGSDGTSWVSLG